MIVAGFDIATTTGFAVLDGAKVLRADAFRAKGETEAEVFTHFRHWFRGLLRDYKVERVAIEEPLRTPMINQSKLKTTGQIELSPRSSMQTYLRLYGMRAIAIQSVDGLGLPPVLEVNQATWRKSFTGNGRAKKEDSLALARQIVPGLVSEDAAEAIGIAWHLNGVLRLEKQLTSGAPDEGGRGALLVGRAAADGEPRLL